MPAFHQFCVHTWRGPCTSGWLCTCPEPLGLEKLGVGTPAAQCPLAWVSWTAEDVILALLSWL